MSDEARRMLREYAEDGARLRQAFFDANTEIVIDAALRMAVAIAKGNKILLCGNGGSAGDAQHLAGEFVNRFLMDRPPLPAIALTTDTSTITAIGNDFGFEQIFEKQVQALGQPGDILVGISTSGNSPNVARALRAARDKGLFTIGLTGRGGGTMAPLCDILIDVQHKHTPLVQEIHITVGHMLCALTDHFLFENVLALQPFLDAGAQV